MQINIVQLFIPFDKCKFGGIESFWKFYANDMQMSATAISVVFFLILKNFEKENLGRVNELKRRLVIGRQLETRPNTLARLFVNRWRGQRRISVFLTKNVSLGEKKFRKISVCK